METADLDVDISDEGESIRETQPILQNSAGLEKEKYPVSSIIITSVLVVAMIVAIIGSIVLFTNIGNRFPVSVITIIAVSFLTISTVVIFINQCGEDYNVKLIIPSFLKRFIPIETY